MGSNYGTVLNCTVSGSINAILEMDHILDCGGIAGDNMGTISGCTFEGYVAGSAVGGIAGANSGTVLDCHNLTGRVSTGSIVKYSGGIIGYIYTNTSNYSNVVVTGNTFSKTVSGQQWGIGNDPRQTPVGPNNNGATPIQ